MDTRRSGLRSSNPKTPSQPPPPPLLSSDTVAVMTYEGGDEGDGGGEAKKRGRGRPKTKSVGEATIPNKQTRKRRRTDRPRQTLAEENSHSDMLDAVRRKSGTRYRPAFVEQVLADMLKCHLEGDEHDYEYPNMNQIYVCVAYHHSCREVFCGNLWELYIKQKDPVGWFNDDYLPSLEEEEERLARYVKFDAECYEDLDTYIQQHLVEKSVHITGEAVSELIRSNFTTSTGAPLKLSPQSCHRILRKLGYAHTHKLKRRVRLTSKRIARIEKFLREYHDALMQEEAGNAVIVCVDESYVHTRHSRRIGWDVVRESVEVNGTRVETDATVGNDRAGDQYNERGQRLIMICAITKDGILAPRTQDGKVDPAHRPANENAIEMDKSYHHSAWVFKADARPKDYHKNMDAHMFDRWVDKQLIPAFEHCYPGKKMILVLDNAPYHWAMDCGFNINTLNKAKEDTGGNSLISIAKTYMTEFTVGEDTYKAPYASRGAPNAVVLRKALHRHIKKTQPDLLKPNVQKKLEAAGHSVIFGAPYCPKFQPIELLWRNTKAYCALEHDHQESRKIQDLFQQVMDYWFGISGDKRCRSKKRPGGYLAQSTAAFSESHGHMDDWLKAHGVTLTGEEPFSTLSPLLAKDGDYDTPVSGDDTTALDDNDEGLEVLV